MSDGTTPYAPPQSPLGGSSSDAQLGELARGTQPWVTLFAVLTSIATAFILLAVVFVALGGAISDEMPAAVALGIAAAYGLGGLLYGIVCWKLWALRGSIARYVMAPGAESLRGMLTGHRGFWRTIGVMAVIALILYAGLFVVMIAMGGLAAMSGVS